MTVLMNVISTQAAQRETVAAPSLGHIPGGLKDAFCPAENAS